MTEKEYRLSVLKSKAEMFKGKDVVLYGTGKNSIAIIASCPEIRIIGVLDENFKGCYFWGKPIVSKTDIIKLRIDTVIIGAQPDSAFAVYERNVEFFNIHNITVYDMFGQDMGIYEQKLWRDNFLYLEQSLDSAKRTIDTHDSIGMNFEDVIAIADETEDSYTFSRDSNAFIDLRKNTWKKHIIPRRSILDLIDYTLLMGKKLFVISEWGLSSESIVSIMKEWGVKEGFSVYTAKDSGYYKFSGLFREVKEIEKESKVLYFGSDVCYDGIISSAYGYDYFPIKKALELLQINAGTTRINKDFLKDKSKSKLFCKIYNDPFCLYKTKGILESGSEAAKLIEEAVLDTDIQGHKYDYRPVLIRGGINPEKNHLRFTHYAHPTVSIIIPVYNQFEYTYKCLKSIQQHTKGITYEIIIADDCSRDETKKLEEYVKGIKIIHNKTNLRFLRNCNNAISYAEGKYILFLNNDTQVQPDWLSSLIELMEKDNAIGMVGSKLVYPDGSLQEAGGILWKDGSAWNYGRNDDPSKPEYNYVKETDYISGAAIMIRRDLLVKLNGFDDRFAPAYCEDSDLAFRVRQAGYKVIYQPKSVVIHFEGISNGTETSGGQKAYQVINTKKFYDKWKNVLDKHYPNGINPFLARDRSINKKTILFIDHYVPMYDKDAGSRTIIQYLKLFVKEGYNIKFIGDNYFPHQPYTEVLEQMGIEVLYGAWYMNHFEDWLKENGGNIQYVWLNRPHISEKYIDPLRKYTNARLAYYGMDLVYLREQRRYDVSGNKEALESSKKWKLREYEIMRKVDVSLFLSQVEIAEVNKEDPSIQCRQISINLFENLKKPAYNPSRRNGLVFVGGFTHDPNVDAVTFIHDEILPILKKKMPDIRIHIVGSNAPKNIMDMNDENLIVHGYVSDEELRKIYNSSRIAFIPLRYGAGVKGKVIEAMANGLPVVTTQIGAEGIDGAEDFLQCAETAKNLAGLVIKLLQDNTQLGNLSKKSFDYVMNTFTVEAAKKKLQDIFDFEV